MTKGSLILSRMLALSTDSQVAAPCGCELFRSGSDGKSVTFRYCDTHAAAPALVEALEGMKCWDCEYPLTQPDYAGCHSCKQARAAIAEARK